MKLSARLKRFLVRECGVKADASNEEFRKAAGEAFASGVLTPKMYEKLTESTKDRSANEFSETMKEVRDTIGELKSALMSNGDEDDEDEEDEDDLQDEKSAKAKTKSKSASKTKSAPSRLEKMITGLGMSHTVESYDEDDEDEEGVKGFSVRVKAAVERYDNTKSAMHFPSQIERGDRVKAHPLAGRPMVDYSESGQGRKLFSASERDQAIAGAFGKFLVNSLKNKSRNIGFLTMPQHDREILLWAMENEMWGGASDGGHYADIKNRKLTPHEQKALIDDSTSGGLEAAPIVFDDQVIQTPLLYGELYPLVTTVPLDRGRRVEGISTGTVTGSWGGVDDTAINLFTTTSYVSAFDTTIFRWEGAITVGLDFLSDTPIDFGAHLTTQYGERLLEDLDDVVATGNGTTQPEGIAVKSGTTSISFGGSTSIGNYESLRFGVAKPEHRANVKGSAVFCGSETSYMRAMAIPVGASDARRLGGAAPSVGGITSYDDYVWMNRPYKINESLGNTKIFYAILARYRMYRRRGFYMRTSTEGSTLIRANEMLMVAMARYGGQLERGACAAVTSTAPA